MKHTSDDSTKDPADPLLLTVPFFELLHLRQSVRAYREQVVEDWKVQRILEAANRAPSAGNLQAFEILVVRDASLIQALVPACHGQALIAQTSLLLLFCSNPSRSAVKYGPVGGEFFALQDATIACAYAELATAALGLGTVWIGAPDPAKVSLVLDLPTGWKPIGLLPIGYRNEKPQQTTRRTLTDVVHQASARV